MIRSLLILAIISIDLFPRIQFTAALLQSHNSNLCLKYPEAVSLADRNVEVSGISWNRLKNNPRQYLVIDSRNNIIEFVGDKPNHTWYEKIDIEMFRNINNLLKLPSIILPLNDWDWPRTTMRSAGGTLYASYCTSEHFNDILIPKGYYGRYKYLSEMNESEWDNKLNKVWFRGTMNLGISKGRFAILNESLSMANSSSYFDVGAYPVSDELFAPLSRPHMSMGEAFKLYRYHLVMDGNCDAWRLQNALASNVVVLKTLSLDRQWFSRDLRPFVHYIPITVNPWRIPHKEMLAAIAANKTIQTSNIRKMTKWTLSHAEEAKLILRNARRFHQQYLSDEAMACYVHALFTKISQLYTFDVTEKIAELVKPIFAKRSSDKRIINRVHNKISRIS